MIASGRSQINLLPQELRETGKVQHLRKFLRRGSFSALVIYLAALFLLLLAYFFFYQKARGLKETNSRLQSSVESLRQTESNLALVRDRIELARSVFARSAGAPEKLVDDALGLLPTGAQITAIKAQEGRITLDGVAATSSDLSSLFRSLEGSGFGEIILKNLALSNLGTGYSFSLEMR